MNKNTKNYREAHNMFACNGILFKHESPRRRETFVTRKITIAVARIALWQKEKFYLGNINAKCDWGHAKDYVQMMWMILQADKAEYWVIANGETTSVREFVSTAFKEVGIELDFRVEGVNEKGLWPLVITKVISSRSEKKSCLSTPVILGPQKSIFSLETPLKAKEKLGWVPEHNLASIVKDMMASDLELFKK